MSIKMHSTEGRYVIGPSNILFASMYVCTFYPVKATGWGSEGVKHHVSLPVRVQELCESRGGRPGLPVLMSLNYYGFCGRKATLNRALALVTICP